MFSLRLEFFWGPHAHLETFFLATVRHAQEINFITSTRPALEKVPPDFIFDVILGRFEKKQGLMRSPIRHWSDFPQTLFLKM